MATSGPLGEIEAEFRDADFGDWRLRRRLLRLAASLESGPDLSIPEAVGSTAAREAAYRFLGNHRVTVEAVLESHIHQTLRRSEALGKVLVVSDSSEFSFSGREGLGRLEGKSRGFLGHFALAVSADERRAPLGVLGVELISREEERKAHRNTHQQKRDRGRESLRWGRMVERTSAALGKTNAIHVMDSEADIYELLAELTGKKHHFVVRAGQDRLTEEGRLSEVIGTGEVLLTREVPLSARPKVARQVSRRHAPRRARNAHLAVSSQHLTLRRPKTCVPELPATVDVNVVRVYETAAPDTEQPVEWILFTSEPIRTAKDAADVVDAYRARWRIEEYFKALKTGCSYEERQLESLRTLGNMLGICAVIAWRMLLLRTLQRDAPDSPASEVVEKQLLEALAARLKNKGERKPFPSNPTVTDLLNCIARLGGHITSNGPPGWNVLWRGYHDLLNWADGYIAGKSAASSDQS